MNKLYFYDLMDHRSYPVSNDDDDDDDDDVDDVDDVDDEDDDAQLAAHNFVTLFEPIKILARLL